MRMKFSIIAILVYCCLAWLALPVVPALADTLNRKQVTLLPAVPDTPFIPQYTGKTPLFQKAFKTVHTKDGLVSLEIYMLAKEQPEQVLDWYKTVLKQYGWSVQGFDPSSNSVTGNRLAQGNQCTIQVVPEEEPGYKSRVVISYQIFKPVVDPSDTDDQTPGTTKSPVSTIAGNAANQPH
jgi:hypothetical protein